MIVCVSGWDRGGSEMKEYHRCDQAALDTHLEVCTHCPLLALPVSSARYIFLPLPSCHTIFLNRHALFIPASLLALFLLPGMLFPHVILTIFESFCQVSSNDLALGMLSPSAHRVSLSCLWAFCALHRLPQNVIHLIVSCACLSPQAEYVL